MRAGISAVEVDYIIAHGTSSPLGDEIELGAVQRLVGNAAARVSMSSTKSCVGHLLGAAGAIEAIFSILAIRDNVAPPTINLDNPSVETPIDLVPHKAREREINVALSNSFGFGGTNASLIFKRFADLSRIGSLGDTPAFAIFISEFLPAGTIAKSGQSGRVGAVL